MKLNDKETYFIAGMCIPLLIIPFVNLGIEILSNLQELFILKLSKKAIILQKECQEIQGTLEEDEKEHTYAIGFQAPENYEYEDDDFDDD